MPSEEFVEWQYADAMQEIPSEQQLFGMLAATVANFGGFTRPKTPAGWKDFWPEPKPVEAQRERDVRQGERLTAKPKEQSNDLDCAVWTT